MHKMQLDFVNVCHHCQCHWTWCCPHLRSTIDATSWLHHQVHPYKPGVRQGSPYITSERCTTIISQSTGRSLSPLTVSMSIWLLQYLSSYRLSPLSITRMPLTWLYVPLPHAFSISFSLISSTYMSSTVSRSDIRFGTSSFVPWCTLGCLMILFLG